MNKTDRIKVSTNGKGVTWDVVEGRIVSIDSAFEDDASATEQVRGLADSGDKAAIEAIKERELVTKRKLTELVSKRIDGSII
jgi:hypothetical protein